MTAPLTVRLNQEEIARVDLNDPPCELTPVRKVRPNAQLEFADGAGKRHLHSLAELSGWAHFSIRVHKGLACQADCAVSDNKQFLPEDIMKGKAKGIRFQPFFLPGATANAQELVGQGLFKRGLHFNGRVTPSSVRLSCECDSCGRTFQIQSFHAGFSDVGYMYSDSGKFTLTIAKSVPGCTPALGKADLNAISQLENQLPHAPDGTAFRFWNPFRCPHCSVPYIDFEKHPSLRETEYYGNYFIGSSPIRFPTIRKEEPSKRSLVQRIFGR